MNSRERVLAVLSGNIPDRVPWIENYVSDEVTAGLLGHENFITGFLLSRDNLGLMDTLPDPDDIELYRPAEKFLERYKGNLAAICSVRSGPSNTYLSMGIEHFCQSIISDPELVREAFCDEIGADRYAIDAAEGVALSRKLIEPKSSRL